MAFSGIWCARSLGRSWTLAADGGRRNRWRNFSKGGRARTPARLGINVLTLYAFSIENWKRPAAEISTLMMLLKRYLRSELKTLLTNDIKFNVIGRMDELSDDIQDELRAAMDRTANDTGMLFNIALNYGGRAEIVDAARRAIESGIRPDDLDES